MRIGGGKLPPIDRSLANSISLLTLLLCLDVVAIIVLD